VARLARWVDVASDQYFALAPQQQALVEDRLRRRLEDPDGLGCSYDRDVDRWTTTAGDGRVLIVYVFRPGQPWLFILRLVVI
jgi:hypothetical protein